MRKKRIKAIIKDFIIMQRYYNDFEKKVTIKKLNKKNETVKMYWDVDKDNIGNDFDDTVKFIMDSLDFYKKEYSKLNITEDLIKKSLYELIADRYLIRNKPDENLLLLANKGLNHHLNGRSFEFNYIINNRNKFAVYIAIGSFVMSTITLTVFIINNLMK